jgi:hypothetical protein
VVVLAIEAHQTLEDQMSWEAPDHVPQHTGHDIRHLLAAAAEPQVQHNPQHCVHHSVENGTCHGDLVSQQLIARATDGTLTQAMLAIVPSLWCAKLAPDLARFQLQMVVVHCKLGCVRETQPTVRLDECLLHVPHCCECRSTVPCRVTTNLA